MDSQALAIGLGVVIGLLVLLLVIMFIYLCFLKCRKKQKKLDEENQQSYDLTGPSEEEPGDVVPSQPKGKLPEEEAVRSEAGLMGSQPDIIEAHEITLSNGDAYPVPNGDIKVIENDKPNGAVVSDSKAVVSKPVEIVPEVVPPQSPLPTLAPEEEEGDSSKAYSLPRGSIFKYVNTLERRISASSDKKADPRKTSFDWKVLRTKKEKDIDENNDVNGNTSKPVSDDKQEDVYAVPNKAKAEPPAETTSKLKDTNRPSKKNRKVTFVDDPITIDEPEPPALPYRSEDL